MLSPEKCHIFYDALLEGEKNLIVEEVIMKTLRFFTYHPSTPKKNEFAKKLIIINDYPMWWCSFPKKDKDVCRRIADTFKKTMNSSEQREIALKESRDPSDSGVMITIPVADHIISFSGPCKISPDVLKERNKWIEDRANDHYRLGLA